MSKRKKTIPQDDLGMMADPLSWPRWPLLPVNRRTEGDWPQTGLLLAVKDHLTTVFLANLFDVEKRTGILKDDFIDNKAVERIVYPSFAEMIADGWVVD